MKTVKAKQTISGSYGQKFAGDEFDVTAKEAQQLESKGLVDVIGDAGEDEDGKGAAAPETEKVKASVNITDNTGKEKKEITKPVTTKKK